MLQVMKLRLALVYYLFSPIVYVFCTFHSLSGKTCKLEFRFLRRFPLGIEDNVQPFYRCLLNGNAILSFLFRTFTDEEKNFLCQQKAQKTVGIINYEKPV